MSFLALSAHASQLTTSTTTASVDMSTVKNVAKAGPASLQQQHFHPNPTTSIDIAAAASSASPSADAISSLPVGTQQQQQQQGDPEWSDDDDSSAEDTNHATTFESGSTTVNTITAASVASTTDDITAETDSEGAAVASQPLQTLKKLQQMLDETDYMTTTATTTRGGEDVPRPPTAINPRLQRHEKDPFLTATTNNFITNPSDDINSRTSREATQSAFPFQTMQSHDPPPDLPPQYLYQQQPKDSDHRTNLPPAHPYQQQQQPTLPDELTADSYPNMNSQQQPPTQPDQDSVRPLWTSKDRSKYKKMQQMQRRADDERRRLEQNLIQQQQQYQQQHATSSDDEDQDGMTDTDDGLGYTLPNLPVYMSDAEGESSDTDENVSVSPVLPAPQQHQPLTQPSPLLNSAYIQPRSDLSLNQQQHHQQYQQYGYLNSNVQQLPPPSNQQQLHQQQAPPFMGNYGVGYPPYMPYFDPQQQQQLPQPYSNIQHHQQQSYPNPQQQQFYPNLQQQMLTAQYAAAWGYPQHRLHVPPSHAQHSTMVSEVDPVPYQQLEHIVVAEVPTTLAEATSRINFDSIQKLSLLFVGITSLSYCAVSPRNLQPLSEYNRHFYDNVRLVTLSTIVPMVNFLLVCDARENDINSVITSFYTSFTVGYALAFVMEVIMTTVLRLGVFAVWEPNIFKLCPRVPILVLPWVLRENRYRPKRITLFAADFLSSCVASPIIEEYVKLKILQLTVRLPRNFQWSTKISTTAISSSSGRHSSTRKRKQRRRLVAEAVPKIPGENTDEVTNINSYVTQMFAVSLGMKLCDCSRRILMYTKASHSNKSFYAFLRGAFPIQELCGTMTALALAKRNVLGVSLAQWQILLPAVLIHGMANLRGMKPLFKWNSATPWSEMQLSPWNAGADDSTLPQLIHKGFAKFMWLVLMGRVLGYCIKNYYLITRQARKRTTTYAGKRAAFSAELEAAEMLKKSKDK